MFYSYLIENSSNLILNTLMENVSVLILTTVSMMGVSRLLHYARILSFFYVT